ncbi:MAG: hypothetical protein LBF34_03540 [Puniceicoccales bacterium]|nr:hypothetical protein [Puniceicoccales bacterium]
MNQLLEMHRHQKVILEALQPKNLVKLSRQLEQLQQIQRQELESRQEQEHERERISIIKN